MESRATRVPATNTSLAPRRPSDFSHSAMRALADRARFRGLGASRLGAPASRIRLISHSAVRGELGKKKRSPRLGGRTCTGVAQRVEPVAQLVLEAGFSAQGAQ